MASMQTDHLMMKEPPSEANRIEDIQVMSDGLIGNEFTGQQQMTDTSTEYQQNAPNEQSGLWVGTAAPEDEQNNKKLDMSLDELIAENTHNPFQEDSHNKYENRFYNNYQQPYHHQYKGRRGPSDNPGINNMNRFNRNGSLYHRNSPFPSMQYQLPPPPPPYVPYTSQQLLMNKDRHTVSPMSSPLVYGPQRNNRIIDELLRRPQQLHALRKARMYRTGPYEMGINPLTSEQPPIRLRSQIVAELLLQQQRTRNALLLATSEQDGNQRVPGRLFNDGVRKDPVMLAEQSALNESELMCPVMIKDESGQLIESPDDSLIIRFKGTDVLKVRKKRGDLILNSGGWRTFSTRLVLNKALKPLGIRIEEIVPDVAAPDQQASPVDSAEKKQKLLSTSLNSTSNEWRVVDNSSVFLATFTDGMVIGNIGAAARSQLMARASVIAQNWKQIKSSLNIGKKKM